MNKFIVSVMIPYIPGEVRDQVLQQEMEKVRELKEQNVVSELYVGANLKNAWMFINAENDDQVMEIMESLPIFPYLYIDQIIMLRELPAENSQTQQIPN